MRGGGESLNAILLDEVTFRIIRVTLGRAMMQENRICLGYLYWCEREEIKFSEFVEPHDNAAEIVRSIDDYDAGMLKLLGVSCSVIGDLVVFSRGRISDQDLLLASMSVPDFEGCNPNIIVILVLGREGGAAVYRKKIKEGKLRYDVDSAGIIDIYRTIGQALHFSLKY
ncbi:hypothetical protein ACN2CC_02040 [Mesorhizobium muleiense]|uniref:hypothetical protein n=1 Tax=Mesorhizobium muleiense TaxID=1004279 RepID=UPI003AFA122E